MVRAGLGGGFGGGEGGSLLDIICRRLVSIFKSGPDRRLRTRDLEGETGGRSLTRPAAGRESKAIAIVMSVDERKLQEKVSGVTIASFEKASC